MMRAPSSFAVVVRRRDGSLHVREREMVETRTSFSRLPFVRGLASLVESLKLGSEALRFSAEQVERDMLAEDAAAKAGAGSVSSLAPLERIAPSKAAKKSGIAASMLGVLQAIGYTLFLVTAADADNGSSMVEEPANPTAREKEKSPKAAMTLMLVVMVAFIIALPQAGAAGVNKWLHLDLEVQAPAFQAITGAFKMLIVVGYLLVTRKAFPDIRRVFQYHGAEHKTISTYEANEPLTVENARSKTTLHPRCGTTFLVMVAMVSILVFTGVGSFLPRIHTGNALADNAIFFAEKLPFLPFITAITFEIQRVFARYCQTGPLRILLWPGFLCQKITTIEPDDKQLEVALASLRVTLFREEAIDKKVGGDIRYADFDQLMKSPQLRRAA